MEILVLLKDKETQNPLKQILEELSALFHGDALQPIEINASSKKLTDKEILQLGYFFKYKFKYQMKRLLQLHSTIDAWYGMAMATQHYNLTFPTFIESQHPFIKIKEGYHLILKKPVANNLSLNKESHFLFLTGANMAGKSTFIKSIGTAVFLAHIGMGVPAESMELSVFDGLLSNINIMDDLAKGESYFYNEVQRIKSSINKINDGKKWLVLIDELFKGTNVEDAMKCSNVVIEGLIKIPNALFILSTHLYEISEQLKLHNNVQFKYFETNVNDDSFSFSYQLKEGVSNDRLGYLILKKEGVVSMLEKI
jgi:DNA mismatch repair ATPase MutS